MNKIFYIEDRKSDFNLFLTNIAPNVEELQFEPISSDRERIINDICNFLDPFGEGAEDMKREAKLSLDESLADADGFVLDYELEGHSRTNVTGCRFYEEYILKHDQFKDKNILFLTRFKGKSSDALREISYKIATEYNTNKVKLKSKHNFKSPKVNKEIIEEMIYLFLSPKY